MKKTIGILIIIASVVGFGLFVWRGINADYEWNNKVSSYWSLSDKASTIAAKSDYIDKFVSALKSSNLADNDALIYKTADNNCANNVSAVETLRDRLDQIKGMDESSFQYQQAIQQITSQEQGEADSLMSTLAGCWYKTNHYYLWNTWFVIFGMLLIIIAGIVGGVALADQEV